MPIHEYACRECGNRFEQLVRISGESLACPSCGSASLARQISLIAGLGSGNGEPRGGGGGCACGGACACGA